MHAKTRIMTVVVVATNVLGNFFLSRGMKAHGSIGDSVSEYISILFSPWVSAGVLLLILWLLSRMALLSWADLSYVLPVTAAGYVLTAVMGRVFMNEQVSPVRWAGTLLIAGGIVLVSTTSVRTHGEPGGSRR